jgi:surface antigen
MRKFIAMILILVTLPGCLQTTNQYRSPRYSDNTGQIGGTIMGGALGALICSPIGQSTGQVVAMILCGLTGAVIGNQLGAQYDRAIQQRESMIAEKATIYALDKHQDGKAKNWYNSETGRSGYFRPLSTYKGEGGLKCREFETNVSAGTKESQGTGAACKQLDGNWRIIRIS